MSKRNLLLLSSSSVHGYEYLQYAADDIKNLLNSRKVKVILFIPYALFNYNCYADKVTGPYQSFGFKVESIHTKPNPIEAIQKAEAIYTGGGNTFKLLKTLYDNNLIEPIRKRVLQDGIPYIGASAGTNIATCSICTTNDMPIVYPPSFAGLNLIPFNINPHYIDVPDSKNHKGETRDDRIKQYHELEDTPPVLGMREGCMLHVQGNSAVLKGITGAMLFIRGEEPKPLAVKDDVSYLL